MAYFMPPKGQYGESEESSNEDGKRKAEGEIENFSRSKKTSRSPDKCVKFVKFGKGESGNGNDELMNMMREMMGDIKELRRDQKGHQKEMVKMREELTELKKEQRNYYKEVHALKEENAELKLELQNVHKKFERLESIEHSYERMEREKRKNNLLITGLNVKPRQGEELKNTMESFLKEHLKLEVKLKTATKVNEKICIITTESMQDKIEVLKNKSKLKNIEVQKSVYINSDLTTKEREIQSKIRKIAAGERKAGKTATTGYQKLITNGQLWKWNEKEDKLVQPSNSGSTAKNC